jgi:hypothetical protein
MSEDLEAVRCALAATRLTLAKVEAERDRLRGLLERLAACAQLRATPSWIEEIRAALAPDATKEKP